MSPQRQSNVPVTPITINDADVTTTTNTTDEFSEIIDIQVPNGYRYEFVPGRPIEMFIPVHEQKSATGNSTANTISLGNDLVNSPSLQDIDTSASETATTGPSSLVVWDNTEDSQVGVTSVDYDGNSFVYTTGDTTDDTLEVYYLWGDSAQVEFRNYAPSEERFEKELIKPLRAFHTADTFSKESYITFPQPFQMLEKEHLKIAIKTGVDLTNWDATADSPNTVSSLDTYGYPDFSIPVRKVPMKA